MLCGLLVLVSFTVLTWSAPLLSRAGHGCVETPLRFTSDGTFQISIFEDLHFGENAWDEWGPQQDIDSVTVMNEILDAESQQLVVLNGDLITGENTFTSNSTLYVDQIVGPLAERGLTWASTYGNHDSDFNLSRYDILGRERLYRNARTSQMVFGNDSGVSNYYLPVYPSNGGSEPSLLLWFFDSRGGFHYQQTDANGDKIGQPNWVDQTVVDWFQQTNAALVDQYNRTIPSLAFVHIPVNASQALQTSRGIDPNHEPGINDDYPLAAQAQGWCPNGTTGTGSACSYGGQDLPFTQALTSTPGLIALFSGHDHGDTWCYKWNSTLPGTTVAGNGLNLCFGQHSGYGGYGTWTRGSRQVLLTEGLLEQVETWIRLETGGVVGRVTLNETYGVDRYPATVDTRSECVGCSYDVVSDMPGTA
ncbi:hypothetical protein B0A50_05641 [Salinomyces thailandicus]|uniref:Calcineurin-like phosphoesterase domain-containing protein n=1 Tax=Salinomyces thailandicus TaxID=706561 RepID=A0A4U0TV62_9PEZI|nr:hypothetical protein B0A50_05641 [Salinomyces thailandica]